MSRTRLRRASFYFVLAGYRYGRCNLCNLSLRCYAQFDASEWVSATEYVKLSSKHIMDQTKATAAVPPVVNTNVVTNDASTIDDGSRVETGEMLATADPPPLTTPVSSLAATEQVSPAPTTSN